MRKITLPIFPLNGVIFFQNSNLPLNIFEEKCMDMKQTMEDILLISLAKITLQLQKNYQA